MFRRRVFSVFAAVLAAGSLAVLPGCEWFQASDVGQRQSPFLSNLTITPRSVPCEVEFSVSFSYDDPQGDIASVRLTRQQGGDATVLEDTPLWPEGISRSNGVVSFPLSFTCDSAEGIWLITVEVADDRAHTSNTLSGEITLNVVG